MMMDHKTRVRAALDGENIDRFPMWYGGDPETTSNVAGYLGVPNDEEAVLKDLRVDFRTVRPSYIGPELKVYPDGACDTIWGIKRGGSYYGQALNHPLSAAETVREIEEYPWPDAKDWETKSVRPAAEAYATEYAVMGGAWSPFFHDVAELFGMETMFLNMLDKPELVEAAVGKAMEFYLELSRRMFEETSDCIDIFFFGNDFGSQKGLICSPEMWKRFFGPGIKSMIDLGHKYGMKTALHSCGSIRSILPSLIEMGLDIVNPIQTTAYGMEPESLQREFGDDIVFFGGVDVQHVLNNGTPQDVKDEALRIIDIFSRGKGFILAPAHDYLLPEIPPENIVALYRTGSECGLAP